MHEAFWNGLFDVRWEEAPLGPEAVRLVRRLRERGYAERTCRDPLPARKVKAAGTARQQGHHPMARRPLNHRKLC
jgi:hypothetical protein